MQKNPIGSVKMFKATENGTHSGSRTEIYYF